MVEGWNTSEEFGGQMEYLCMMFFSPGCGPTLHTHGPLGFAVTGGAVPKKVHETRMLIVRIHIAQARTHCRRGERWKLQCKILENIAKTCKA